MVLKSVASIRMRAELARRLANELKEPKAVAALREIADTLDEEAERLHSAPLSNVRPIHPSGAAPKSEE
jgi:hypothetical protein